MSTTLARVIEFVGSHSGVPATKLNAHSAIDQDVKIFGDDIDELAEALAKEFGAPVGQWPWHRFVDLNEPHALTSFFVLWRLLTWSFRGRLSDPSPYERLELGHIAAVIDRGEWFEP